MRSAEPERSPSRMNAVSSSEGVACSMPMTSESLAHARLGHELVVNETQEVRALVADHRNEDLRRHSGSQLSALVEEDLASVDHGPPSCFSVRAISLDENRGRPYRVSEVLYAGMAGCYQGTRSTSTGHPRPSLRSRRGARLGTAGLWWHMHSHGTIALGGVASWPRLPERTVTPRPAAVSARIPAAASHLGPVRGDSSGRIHRNEW